MRAPDIQLRWEVKSVRNIMNKEMSHTKPHNSIWGKGEA